MHPLNPLFALTVFAIAFATAYCINLKFKFNNSSGRYETIDGLRGFLAIGVFIHHCAIWHQYLESGKWEIPKSVLYTELGSTSVALFFMITSFLFVNKILNTGKQDYNWRKFFISRFFRLVPMYYFSLLLIVLISMTVTGWQLNVGLAEFINAIWHWLIFTIAEEKTINNYEFTNFINAGVTWSLSYEWLFYFSLPLIGLVLLQKKPGLLVLLCSFAFILFFIWVHSININHLLAFVSGAIAPVLLKFTNLSTKINHFAFGCVIIGSLLLMTIIEKAYLIKFLVTLVFTLVAVGNSVFGLLKNSTLKFLGEICYSTYLLHGIVIFTAMHFFIGLENARLLTASNFCIIIFCLTPSLVGISFLGYNLIEKPWMNYGKKIK